MTYYLCEEEECKLAFTTYQGFTGHWTAKHPDKEKPSKEDVATEVIPEGFLLAGKTRPSPEDRPSEFIEKVRTSLEAHAFPPQLKDQILGVLALHPEAEADPQNFTNLLYHLLETSVRGRAYMPRVNLIVTEVFGEQAPSVPYIPTYRQTPFPYFPSYPQYLYPLSHTYHHYYPYTYPTHEEEKVTRRAEREERISRLEVEIEELKKNQKEILELLKQREEVREKEAEKREINERFKALEEKIERFFQRKEELEEGGWFKKYLEERDKRFESEKQTIQERQERHREEVERLKAEISRVKEEKEEEVRKAIEKEREYRTQVKKELEELGYSPRKKEVEESTIEIIKEQVAPAIITEAKEMRKLVEKVALGSTKERLPSPPPSPLTKEEVEKIPEIMEIEERLKEFK